MAIPSAFCIEASMIWRCRQRILKLERPLVMGILNVTPDSFSDGGLYATRTAALEQGAKMIAAGAAIIDVGGESTRPGAAAVTEAEEIDRIAPVIEGLAANFDVAISVDSSKLAVMAAAVAAGASIVNDVRALAAAGAREWAASTAVGVCLMHMQGEPGNMQVNPQYGDVVAEVTAFLAAQRATCIAAGIDAAAIALDPGIGFGKTLAHNLTLLRDLPTLVGLGSPVLVGVSRKSLIARVLHGRELGERLFGGLGLAALCVAQGAKIVRTHDVAATWDAIRMVDAVMQGTEA
jgi:dihydropteroate synthase